MIRVPVEPAITDYLHSRAVRQGIPLSGTFELTPVCNMDCKMCYIRMSRQQQEAISPLRSAQQWLALAREAREAGMLFLLLTGGEPFLHPQFQDILTGLNEMGFVISINTNGTLIDEETVEWLKTVAPTRLNITLYGASNETYDKLCGNPAGFTQVTKAIRLLKEAGLSVKLNCSVTPYNVFDLEGIYQFAREQQLVVQATSYMFPPVRKDASQFGFNDRFLPADAAYYSAKIELLNSGTQAFLTRPVEDVSIPCGETEDACSSENKIRCRAGKSSFWVTWQGIMMPCGMMPSEAALNVFDTGFAKAWDRTRRIAEGIRLPAVCASCEAKEQCRACAAMVYTENGSFDSAPAYRCEMMRSFFQERAKLKSEILLEQVNKK